MAKIKYANIHFKTATKKLIAISAKIVEEYSAQNFILTVRQLYYQLVARDVIPNTEQSYKRVTSTINDARMAGLIDWDAIEDRTRAFETNSRWGSASQLARDCANQFHMDLWEGQSVRPFVIVEKEALVNVFQRVCSTYDVPILAARGYPSASVLQEFGDLLHRYYRTQEIIILHFGDHDPSGIDMSRDLEHRISTFSRGRPPIDLRRVALNMDQIEELSPPPNPAKVTDSRFKEYQKQYGDESWELDALSPSYLANLVISDIEPFIERDKWEARKKQIEHQRGLLRKAANKMEKDHG